MAEFLNIKTFIDGNSKITSWNEADGSFSIYVSPRMATAREINDAFVEMAKNDTNVVIGKLGGINWVGR